MIVKIKPYIVITKATYFSELILGLIMIILGVILILYYSKGLGYGILAFGSGICSLLLEQKIMSMGKYKF
jgi:hypothetical protein